MNKYETPPYAESNQTPQTAPDAPQRAAPALQLAVPGLRQGSGRATRSPQPRPAPGASSIPEGRSASEDHRSPSQRTRWPWHRAGLMYICASRGSQKCFAKHPLCRSLPQDALG